MLHIIMVQRMDFLGTGQSYHPMPDAITVAGETLADLFRFGRHWYGRCIGQARDHATHERVGYRFVKIVRDDPHNPCRVITRLAVVDPADCGQLAWTDMTGVFVPTV